MRVHLSNISTSANSTTLFGTLRPGAIQIIENVTAAKFLAAEAGLLTEQGAGRLNFSLSDISVTDFGPCGSGFIDSTPALQAAFAFFSGNTATGDATNVRSGKLYVPAGFYQFNQTLEYVGNYSNSFELYGEGGGGTNTDTVFVWTGANTGESRMFHFMGASNLTLRDFVVNCNSRAKHGIQLDSFNRNFPTNFRGATQGIYHTISIGSCREEDGASSWLVGYIPSEGLANGVPSNSTLQVDDQRWNSCNGGQGDGSVADIAHVRLLQSGNVKNLVWDGCQFIAGRFGIKGEAGFSGYTHIFNCAFESMTGTDDNPQSTCGAGVYGNGQHVTIRNCGMEGNIARFAYDNGSGTGNNMANWIIDDCYYASNAPADDFVLMLSGSVDVSNSDFINTSTGGGPHWSKVACQILDQDGINNSITFKNVGLGGLPTGGASGVNTGPSTGTNTFPLYDYGNNNVLIDEYTIEHGPNVNIENCHTIDPATGNQQNKMLDARSLPGEMIRAKLLRSQPVFLNPHQLVIYNGLENSYTRKDTFTYQDFAVGFNTKTLLQCVLPIPNNSAGIQLTKVEVKVTTAFATSDSNNVYLSVGTTNPGGQEFLITSPVSGITAPFVIGRNPADVGSAFTGAAFGRPVYDINSATYDSGSGGTPVYITVTCDAGHATLSALNAGAFEIRYFYEVLW